MPTFLVIRFSSIGDILMTTAAVRCLKLQVPGARVLFATKPAFTGLVAANPHVDKVLTLDSNLVGLAAKAYKEGVTHVVDLHSNVRSRLLCAMLPFAKVYRVAKGTADREALIRDKRHQVAPLHMVDRHLAALQKLGVCDDGGGLEYHVPKPDAVDYTLWAMIGQRPYAAVCLGGTHACKKLPEEKAIELLRSIELPVILLGGRTEAEEGQRIAGTLALEGRWDIFSACGSLTLGQSGSVLAQAAVVYSHDTGLMHMAAALGKPVVSIWGSTVPAFGMYPYARQFAIQQVAGLACRPCHRHGADVCPEGHFRCMKDQSFGHPLAWYDMADPGTRAQMAQIHRGQA